MTLFRSQTHQEIWQMANCHTCFQPEEAARRLHGKEGSVCPIWAKAMRTDRKPVEWDRKPRAADMDRTIKCNSHTPKPPIHRREKHFEDVPLFEVTPYKVDVGFVPVDGWIDRPKKDGVDHA